MSTKLENLHIGLDRMDMSLVSGWARYRDSAEQVEIEMLVNDVSVGTFRADQPRNDLANIRADTKFAFRIQPGFENELLLKCLPMNANVALRDAKTKQVLGGSEQVWSGLAPEGQAGIVNENGQYLRLAKGRFVVPLSERGEDWRRQILEAAKKLASDAAAGGFVVSAAYGTLLGGVRTGSMIPHDDDVDMMFIAKAGSMLDAVQELHALEGFLREQGYKVKELSNGQIHVAIGLELPIDIFLSWFENEKLNLTFTVKDGPSRQEILPLETVVIEGVELPAPKVSFSLLEAIYGPSWSVPDPSFQWRRPQAVAEYFAPIHNYNRSANLEYWRDYYSTRSAVSPPDYPSQFALFLLGLRRNPGLVVDLGCGSARDSIFLASQGIRVIGVDYADSAVTENRERAQKRGLTSAASFLKCDVSDLADVGETVAHVQTLRSKEPLCVYSRFFFHAIDNSTESAALLLVKTLMSESSDFAAFEFRTEEDRDREKVTPAHYRRYVNIENFISKAESAYGLKCVYRAEGLGYAIFGADDAYVARMVFVRNEAFLHSVLEGS